MPFPPRGRPSNSWWRSWTECCCLSLTRWVSHTSMHPLPPMKPHTDMHAVTKLFMRGFFLCCPDVLSVVSGIWGLWTPNNKNNRITLCLATVSQIAQISERSIGILGTLKMTLNSISTAVYSHRLSQLVGLFLWDTNISLIPELPLSLLSTWTCRHPLNSTPHHVRTRPALALLTTTQFLLTMPCPPTLASWATRMCAPR